MSATDVSVARGYHVLQNQLTISLLTMMEVYIDAMVEPLFQD